MWLSTLAEEQFVGDSLFTKADQSVNEDIQSQLICCPKVKPAACYEYVYPLETSGDLCVETRAGS